MPFIKRKKLTIPQKKIKAKFRKSVVEFHYIEGKMFVKILGQHKLPDLLVPKLKKLPAGSIYLSLTNGTRYLTISKKKVVVIN